MRACLPPFIFLYAKLKRGCVKTQDLSDRAGFRILLAPKREKQLTERKICIKMMIKRNTNKKICYNGTVEIQGRVLKIYTLAEKRALAE